MLYMAYIYLIADFLSVDDDQAQFGKPNPKSLFIGNCQQYSVAFAAFCTYAGF